MKKVFTTGMIAKECAVAPRTVSKWIDSGKLVGYRIPGSQDRRVPRQNLIRFMEENGIPCRLTDAYGVLVIGGSASQVAALAAALNPDGSEDYAVTHAPDGFAAGGLLASDIELDAVVIDLTMGRTEGLSIVERIRTMRPASTVLIVLAAEDEADPERLAKTYALTDALKQPLSAEALAGRLRELLEPPVSAIGQKSRRVKHWQRAAAAANGPVEGSP